LGPYTFLSSLFSKHPVCVPPTKWETMFRTHKAQLAKLQFYLF
jgi:hypothetical protein